MTHKLKKIILASALGIGLSSAAIATSVVLASCSSTSSSEGMFFKTESDPYKQLEMMGRSLDYAYFKNPDQNGNKYQNKAKEVNNIVKSYIKDLSTNLKKYTTTNDDKSVDFKNKSILFLCGEEYQFSANESSGDKILSLNKFNMEQPILYPTVYGSADSEAPGLGLNFPAPVDPAGLRLCDDWFEIGASALNSGVTSVPTDITSAWNGTADFVIYLYDSKKLTLKQEQELVHFIWDDTSAFNKETNVYAKKLLKKDAAIKKVIPLDREFFYYPTFSVYGNAQMARLFVNLLTDAADGTMGNSFGGLSSSGSNKSSGFKPRVATSVPPSTLINHENSITNLDVSENTNIITRANEGSSANAKCDLPPLDQSLNAPLTNDNKIKPDASLAPIAFGTQTNLFSTAYNTLGQLASLGILADISMKNNQSPTNEPLQYRDFPGIFMEKLSSNSQPKLQTPSSVRTITNNDLNTTSNIPSFNMYCVTADRSSVMSYGKDWSLTKPIYPYPKTSSSYGIAPAMELAHVDYNSLIRDGLIKTCAYTERCDTIETRSSYLLYINETNGNIVTLEQYYNDLADKKYFNLIE